ncbi:uncharacterized protein LOC127732054 [Mytilus californianus]|uniref:uncharacterized protein LOC127732054 n=1 Tax=Mytilus californianus TaxID=6549 RepID=UPI0022477237|nr:uncharacterized protein LOC127732054 [Mytilus californianus]XP_052097057.1 uncharacterized protein LOC127732054 [Mytilus californianus]
MKDQQLLLSVFIALLSCDEGRSTVNLTLYRQEMSWKNASNFCSQHNGVLESNTTVVIDQFEIEGNGIQNVWFGKYEAYSQWAYIRGCFFINGNVKHFAVWQLEELDCQKMCEKYKFYTIKGTDCYCLHGISSFEKSNHCYCTDCFKVWEHQLQEFDTGEYDNPPECIAVTNCLFGTLRRRYDPCELNHNVTCDNNFNLGFSSDNHHDASIKCERQGSFIKWFPENFCTSDRLNHPFWTSERRQKHISINENLMT